MIRRKTISAQPSAEATDERAGRVPRQSICGEVNAPNVEPLLHERDAAQRLGLTEASLQKYRYLGTGPAFVRPGGRKRGAVRYQLSDLDEWIAANRVVPKAGKRG